MDEQATSPDGTDRLREQAASGPAVQGLLAIRNGEILISEPVNRTDAAISYIYRRAGAGWQQTGPNRRGAATIEFDGSWSNYPFFASGTIVVASGKEGAFFLRCRPQNLAP